MAGKKSSGSRSKKSTSDHVDKRSGLSYRKVQVPDSTVKWDEPGVEIEGEFLGLVPGSLGGKLVRLREIGAGGQPSIVVASAPARLETALSVVSEGDHIKIVYNGTIEGGRYGTVKDFEVFVAE